MLTVAASSAGTNWAWVPWALSVIFGIATVFLTLRAQMRTRQNDWLSQASKEVAGLRNEMKSDIAGARGELNALITGGKAETLLAINTAKTEVQLALGQVDGRVQQAEGAMSHLREQVKELKQDLDSGLVRISEAVSRNSEYGRQAPGVPVPGQRTSADAPSYIPSQSGSASSGEQGPEPAST